MKLSHSFTAMAPTHVESAQRQALQFFHDVYEGYWSTFYLLPGCFVAVDVAVAVDSVTLSTPTQFGFVAPGPSFAVISLHMSPSVGLEADVHTSRVPADATRAATPAAT